MVESVRRKRGDVSEWWVTVTLLCLSPQRSPRAACRSPSAGCLGGVYVCVMVATDCVAGCMGGGAVVEGVSVEEALAFVRRLPLPPEDVAVLAGLEGGGGGGGGADVVGLLRLLCVWRLRGLQGRAVECLHGVVQEQLKGGKRGGRVDMKKGEVGR